MTLISRRHFFQFSSSFFLALGLNKSQLKAQVSRYQQILSKNTARKLALLVGINGYQDAPLNGCITDVDLQKELLIHCFGFQPQDILSLTDNTTIKPTRANILAAFEEHLIKQAQPQDVVVYHFSGHGDRVVDPTSDFSDGYNSTFVSVDRQEKGKEKIEVNDIMGHTLFLLMSAIATENLTVVLDSCHSGGGKRGNLTVRSLRDLDKGKLYPSSEELAYQENWLEKLNISPQEFVQKRRENVAKGVVIASAKRNQYAADTPFDGFYAGAFTYLLTQYLWQNTTPIKINNLLANVARSTTNISATGQIPEWEAKNNQDQKPIYFLRQTTTPAEGVIKSLRGNKIECWLGGIDAQSLEAFDENAIFEVISPEQKKVGLVTLIKRNGLTAIGKITDNSQEIKTGFLLQERVRALPKNLTLKIGLDPSLGEDKIKAKQIINELKNIEPIELGTGETHYLLGRFNADLAKIFQDNKETSLPSLNSIGLADTGLTEIIPDSFGEGNENIERALQRLNSKFRSLLAARLVKIILNPGSSRLNIKATMQIVGSKQEVIAESFTPRSNRNLQKTDIHSNIKTESIKFIAGVPQIPLGRKVQITITNQENKNLYISVLVIDSAGDMTIIFPNSWTANIDSTLIKVGQIIEIPQVGKDPFMLTVQPPLGNTEVLIIASDSPLKEALKLLQNIANNRGTRNGPISISNNFTEVIDNLIGDVSQNSRNSFRGLGVEADPNIKVIDTTKLGAMSISFRAIS
jgi:hypothetical protein